MTALQRWSNGDGIARVPFSGLVDELFRGFDLFPDFFRDDALASRGVDITADFELEETPEAWIARCDLPGVEPKDIQLQIEGDRVMLTAERRRQRRDDRGGMEQSSVRYARSFRLPSGIDADKAEAELKNGVLTLRLPKSEGARPKVIEVKNAHD